MGYSHFSSPEEPFESNLQFRRLTPSPIVRLWLFLQLAPSRVALLTGPSASVPGRAAWSLHPPQLHLHLLSLVLLGGGLCLPTWASRVFDFSCACPNAVPGLKGWTKHYDLGVCHLPKVLCIYALSAAPIISKPRLSNPTLLTTVRSLPAFPCLISAVDNP